MYVYLYAHLSNVVSRRLRELLTVHPLSHVYAARGQRRVVPVQSTDTCEVKVKPNI